ncbi:MAG TPA: ATP-binding protein, partial [Candidatus Krumholzibacteria bacterium]
VKAEAGDRHVLIKVSDNGPGMSAEVLKRCFEPFFTTKHRDISTGLGLSIVYGLVKEAGGEIDIRSERGAGTTFVLRLARSADPEQVEARRPRRAAQLRIADARLAAIFEVELRALGYDVARGAVDGPAPEVVVTDRIDDAPLQGKLVVLADGPDRPASAVALGSKPSVQAIRKALAHIAATGAKEGRP